MVNALQFENFPKLTSLNQVGGWVLANFLMALFACRPHHVLRFLCVRVVAVGIRAHSPNTKLSVIFASGYDADC